MRKRMRKLISILIPVFCAVAVILLLRFFFIFGYVPTESMEPTLEKGSYILGVRIYGELKTGDIVIFEHDGRLLVKRIAACSGDTILRNDSMGCRGNRKKHNYTRSGHY